MPTNPEAVHIPRYVRTAVFAVGAFAASILAADYGSPPEHQNDVVLAAGSDQLIQNAPTPEISLAVGDCMLSQTLESSLCVVHEPSEGIVSPDAVSLPKPTTTTTTVPPPPAPIAESQPQPSASPEAQPVAATAEQREAEYLWCVAKEESTHNPTAYNVKGPYYGKYQFLQSTWDGFVPSIGREDLVGVDILQVDEATQDWVALEFLRAGRNKEWIPADSHCRYLLG